MLLPLLGVDTATPNGVNNTGVGGKCPVGYYCPEGSPLPLPCAAGSYRYTHIHTNANTGSYNFFFI